jgi:hypothetical protein
MTFLSHWSATKFMLWDQCPGEPSAVACALLRVHDDTFGTCASRARTLCSQASIHAPEGTLAGDALRGGCSRPGSLARGDSDSRTASRGKRDRGAVLQGSVQRSARRSTGGRVRWGVFAAPGTRIRQQLSPQARSSDRPGKRLASACTPFRDSVRNTPDGRGLALQRAKIQTRATQSTKGQAR